MFFEEIVGEMDGYVMIVKINIDENLNVLNKYGVCGIFILMLFKNGEVVFIKVGVMFKGKIVEWIENVIDE